MTRRADPYEIRARELAVAAGLDPDGHVERPGMRSMPVWCTFRDAARAAHVATEAAAVAAELLPQRPEFQNAPLQIFGHHDENTIAQMRNCMGVGNVVAGVICADGHLGYAQPVGGVIAYEKQISISGVGGLWGSPRPQRRTAGTPLGPNPRQDWLSCRQGNG
jgi:tRNA-splicing ligase RtcB (3'-phosphate/5'-hydroxy nucleic acid ligase)